MTYNLFCIKSIPGRLTKGKTYKAIYERDEEDQGWFVIDDSENAHWLSKWDGKNHSNIFKEPFIKEYFLIIK